MVLYILSYRALSREIAYVGLGSACASIFIVKLASDVLSAGLVWTSIRYKSFAHEGYSTVKWALFMIGAKNAWKFNLLQMIF